MLRKFLNIVDRFYRWFYGLKPVGSIFYIGVKTYKGAPLNLSDGTTIKRGDRICTLHFNNERILSLHNESGGNVGFSFVRYIDLSLSELAKTIYREKAYEGIVALNGITWMARKGVKKIGFDSFPVKSLWQWLWLRIKFSLYLKSAKKKMAKRIRPHNFWMSRGKLLSYLD